MRRAQRRELLVDLQGELTCRGQDDGEDAGRIFRPFVQDGHGEGNGLAGTGPGTANAVAAAEERRYAGGLDRSRTLHGERAQGGDEPGGDIQRSKRRQRLEGGGIAGGGDSIGKWCRG